MMAFTRDRITSQATLDLSRYAAILVLFVGRLST